jgi:hypothetical protein
LLDIASPQRQGRRHEAAGVVAVETVGGQELGDALHVPRGSVERAERERERMHALVQQQMSPVGGIRLVGHPEPLAVAEPIREIGNIIRQQSGRAKSLAIDDETAAGPPLAVRIRIEREMPAPCGPRLVEDAGQILDAVAGTDRSIGDEHEVIAFQHSQPCPSCRRHERVDGDRVVIAGNGPPDPGQAGGKHRREDERPQPHGRRV